VTTAHVNLLNIGLMLASLAAACVLPFEVFLLSYAVLGPLHYLTEISWLHDRRYFTPRRLDWAPLVACSLLVSLGTLFVIGERGHAALDGVRLGGTGLGTLLGAHTTELTFLAFGVALLFVLTRDLWWRIIGVTALLAAATLLHVPPGTRPEALVGSLYWTIFAAYLTTVIHVCVFTGLFILWGALKARSATGHLSLAVFLACIAAAFLLPQGVYSASAWARSSFDGNFAGLSQVLLHDVLGMPLDTAMRADLFTDGTSVRLMRFIAFAYTYHYLNWFSKTSVIRWHEVPPARFAVVGALWAASLALYAWDYAIGLRWLFALSFAHVLLEFPLNHQSMIGIGRELLARVLPSARPATTRA
jgi:hypothetical protein